MPLRTRMHPRAYVRLRQSGVVCRVRYAFGNRAGFSIFGGEPDLINMTMFELACRLVPYKSAGVPADNHKSVSAPWIAPPP